MTILEFPPVETADEHGLLGVGGDLAVESLLLAYRNGIFPWPVDDSCLTWFAPPERAILYLNRFRPSGSLRRARNKGWAYVAINKNFSSVITECQKLVNREEQGGTWITDEIVAGYIDLHKAGFAHSFECYKDNVLVGGLYGVGVGGIFCAESMFYRVSDASKLALWFMNNFLQHFGMPWVDLQVINPFSKSMGAEGIPREEFMRLLKERVNLQLNIPWKCPAKVYGHLHNEGWQTLN